MFWLFHPEFLIFENYYNQKRIIQLVFFCALFVFLFFPSFYDSYIFILKKNCDILILLGTFFVCGLFSVVFSTFLLISLQEWLSFFVLILAIPLFVIIIREDNKGFNVFLSMLMLSASLYVFKFNFVLFLATVSGDIIKSTVIYSGAVNINFVAQPLGLLAPFFFIYGFYGRKVIKLLSSAFIFLILLLLLVIDNRGVLLSLIIVASFWSLWKKDIKFFNYICVLVVASIITYFLIVYSVEVSGIESQIKNVFSSSSRDILWHDAVNAFYLNPIFGIGPYGFTFQSPFNRTAHPHNFYLQILAEWGVICFALLSIVFFIAVFRSLNSLKQRNSDLILISSFLGLFEGFCIQV